MPDLNLGDLALRSAAFDHGAAIPARHTGDGEDAPPPLEWSGVPEGTAELVLVLHDPDAPLVDGFTHWTVHGIAPDVTALPTEVTPPGEPGATFGCNELGEAEYMGPAPPPGHGPHHYFFHLFALDEPIVADRPLTRAELLGRMDGHVIEQARLVGTYER